MERAEKENRFDTKVVRNQRYRAPSFSTANRNAANMKYGVESNNLVLLRSKKSSQTEVVAEEI
jgi:hypothetical protein